MTEDLRARLARIDPARRLDAAGLAESPTAHEIRERVMQTIEDTATTPVAAPRWRRVGLVAGAAASVAAIAVVAAVATGGDSAPKPAPKPRTTLALNAPGGGPTMTSCIRFSVDILRDMPVAFAGTVTAVTPQSVTLDVDRWYKGGSADQVTVATPDATTSVALDGIELTQGGRYLIAATDGTINTCGYSGAASAELESAFGEAFPG
jgi:hypothetical protein